MSKRKSKNSVSSYGNPIDCYDVREELAEMYLTEIMNPDRIDILLDIVKDICPLDYFYLDLIKDILIETEREEDNCEDQVYEISQLRKELKSKERFIDKLQNENEDYVYEISQLRKKIKKGKGTHPYQKNYWK